MRQPRCRGGSMGKCGYCGEEAGDHTRCLYYEMEAAAQERMELLPYLELEVRGADYYYSLEGRWMGAKAPQEE